MGFWFTFLFWLGTQVVSALLFRPKTENARPSGLDEFQVPTATEGRAIPIVVGKVKIAGPNVVWYGDLSTRAITEEVGGFLGIGGKDVTKGYEYRIGVQMVLASGPIDGIDRVWMGDKVIASGETSSNIVVSDPGFSAARTPAAASSSPSSSSSAARSPQTATSQASSRRRRLTSAPPTSS